jgi:hypothetical protein
VRTVGHLGFVGENSLLPRFSLGGEVAAGLAWRSLVSELAIGIVPRATAALADRPDVSAQFELVFLAWRTCGGFRGEVLSLLGCATLRGSRLFARGQGASPSFEETAHVPSLEPGVLFRAPSGGIGVEAAASLVVPLRRPRFVILDGESERELFQPAAAGVVLRLAAGYEF